MNDSRFPRRTIDDEIDRVVRELVALDPRPGLRRRVLSRLERKNSIRVFGPRVFVPVGALLALLIAVFVWRPFPASMPTQTIAQNPASPPQAAGPATAAPVPSPRPPLVAQPEPVGVTDASRGPSVFGPRTGHVNATTVTGNSAVGLPRFTATVDTALPMEPAEGAPAAFAPIAIAPLPAMNDIRVAPLEIKRISVPPLSTRGQ